MRLNFWPFNVTRRLHEQVDRLRQDVFDLERKLAYQNEMTIQWMDAANRKTETIKTMTAEVTDLRTRFATGLDAQAGSYMIGGYSSKKSGLMMEAAIGKEVLASGQLVIIPMEVGESSNPDNLYMFRLNILRNSR
jgi:hypothetical protein